MMKKNAFIIVAIILVFFITKSNNNLYADNQDKNRMSIGIDVSVNTWDFWFSQLMLPDTDTERSAVSAGPLFGIVLNNNVFINASLKKSTSYIDEVNGSISRTDAFLEGFIPIYENIYAYLSINYFYAEKSSNYFWDETVTIKSIMPHAGLSYRLMINETIIINPIISITRPIQNIKWYDGTSLSLTASPGIYAGLVMSHEKLTSDSHIQFSLNISTEHYKMKVNEEKSYTVYHLPEGSAWDHYYSIGFSVSYLFDMKLDATVQTQNSTNESYDRH